MFIIVHENFVTWGPKPWNKLGFEDVLRTDCEVEYTLPQRNDNQDPIIINENTKILKVVALDAPQCNPKIQRLNGPYYNFYDDKAESYMVVEDLPIDFVRGNLKGRVATNRYTKEVEGVKVTIQGHEVTVDTSRNGRQIFFDAALTMTDSETIGWKFPETWIDVTKSDMQQIVAAGKAHIQTWFDWEKNKIIEIDNATTLAELDAIDIGDPVEPERPLI